MVAIEVRRLAGRSRFACLSDPASLDNFYCDAASGLDRRLLAERGTGPVVETAMNVLLIVWLGWEDTFCR